MDLPAEEAMRGALVGRGLELPPGEEFINEAIERVEAWVSRRCLPLSAAADAGRCLLLPAASADGEEVAEEEARVAGR